MNPHVKYTAKTALVFISWIPVCYFLVDRVCFISKINGSSMSPSLNPVQGRSDYVLIWKWNFKNDLKINDVIIYRSPMDPDKLVTKRVKGLHGDEIITRFPYLKQKASVPVNHLWCEGDNIRSIDSNTYGPISNGLVVGKVVQIIFPLSRFGKVAEGGRECRESKLKLLE